MLQDNKSCVLSSTQSFHLLKSKQRAEAKTVCCLYGSEPLDEKITENRSDFQSQLFQSCIKICHYQGPLSIPSYEYSTSPIT